MWIIKCTKYHLLNLLSFFIGLFQYFFSVLIIFCLEIAAGIIAYIYRNKVSILHDIFIHEFIDCINPLCEVGLLVFLSPQMIETFVLHHWTDRGNNWGGFKDRAKRHKEENSLGHSARKGQFEIDQENNIHLQIFIHVCCLMVIFEGFFYLKSV